MPWFIAVLAFTFVFVVCHFYIASLSLLSVWLIVNEPSHVPANVDRHHTMPPQAVGVGATCYYLHGTGTRMLEQEQQHPTTALEVKGWWCGRYDMDRPTSDAVSSSMQIKRLKAGGAWMDRGEEIAMDGELAKPEDHWCW